MSENTKKDLWNVLVFVGLLNAFFLAISSPSPGTGAFASFVAIGLVLVGFKL